MSCLRKTGPLCAEPGRTYLTQGCQGRARPKTRTKTPSPALFLARSVRSCQGSSSSSSCVDICFNPPFVPPQLLSIVNRRSHSPAVTRSILTLPVVSTSRPQPSARKTHARSPAPRAVSQDIFTTSNCPLGLWVLRKATQSTLLRCPVPRRTLHSVHHILPRLATLPQDSR